MEHPPLVALVGNPNAGKSALFNALTGARQKVGNYPGVTVERKSGRTVLPDGRAGNLLDFVRTHHEALVLKPNRAYGGDGIVIGAPYAVDVWPPQWRTDVIGPVNNGQFFETWEKVIELGPKVQKPPQTFTFVMAIGTALVGALGGAGDFVRGGFPPWRTAACGKP